jgi:hypothetical protein
LLQNGIHTKIWIYRRLNLLSEQEKKYGGNVQPAVMNGRQKYVTVLMEQIARYVVEKRNNNFFKQSPQKHFLVPPTKSFFLKGDFCYGNPRKNAPHGL